MADRVILVQFFFANQNVSVNTPTLFKGKVSLNLKILLYIEGLPLNVFMLRGLLVLRNGSKF